MTKPVRFGFYTVEDKAVLISQSTRVDAMVGNILHLHDVKPPIQVRADCMAGLLDFLGIDPKNEKAPTS